jgi:Fe-Mn family superoxide dismutase
MAIALPPLPYANDALSPHLSERTLNFHYGKHHAAYVANLNKLIEGTELSSETLENIIRKTAGDASRAAIFNNAAQAWNHAFYWQSLKANGGGRPSGNIARKINADFGSYEKFVEQFKNAGLTQFGSGWAWLVLNKARLEVVKTANADTPLAHDMKPVLTIDVWEHAYYLDYQNRRADYLDAVIGSLLNWDFADSNIS